MIYLMLYIASRETPLQGKESLSSSSSSSQARETLSVVMKMKVILCKLLTLLYKTPPTNPKN